MMDQHLHTAAALPCARGIDSLREVVRSLLRAGPDATPDERLRASARAMCDDARARGARVEELLVSLKQMWPSITAGERFPRSESSRLLERVVTLCVKEYYAPLG